MKLQVAVALSGVGGSGGAITGGLSGSGGGPLAGSGGAASGGEAGSAGTGATGGETCGFVSEFADWPAGASPEEIGQLLVTDYLSRTRGSYDYSDACAWYGGLGYTQVTGDATRTRSSSATTTPIWAGRATTPSLERP